MLAIGSLSRFLRLLATTFLLFESFARLEGATDRWPTTTWEQTSPESEGIDSGVLAEAVEYVQANKIPLHSLLIVRRGHLVLDSYFYPYSSATLHDLASATKSVTSILAGVAVQNGFLKGVTQPALPLLSLSSIDEDPRRRMVSVEDLLTMRSGLDCGLHKNEVELAAMRRASDWAAFAINLPFNAEPGTRFAYCSCNQHLISSLITAQTHLSELELARKYLFAPLGIKDAVWPADPLGRSHGWGDLHLYPRDMAKIGYLFLHQGRWDGTQIVSEEWVRRSTSSLVTVREGVGYGYSWWIDTTRQPAIYQAEGRGGQRIAILPREQVVVVVTGGGVDTDQIAPFLFRAIKSDQPLPVNPIAARRLKADLVNALRPTKPGQPSSAPDTAKTISGSLLSLESNPLDLESISLGFGIPARAIAILKFRKGSWSFPVGLDGRYRVANQGPYGLPIGAVGRWQSTTEFLLDVNTIANINHFLFTIRFERNRAHITMSEVTGELKDVEVEARLTQPAIAR